jgi:broad specificity phosphatase PhoE
MVLENSLEIEEKFENAKWENGSKIDIIIASPFNRTRETAEIIKEKLNFSGEIIIDERIRETNFADGNNGQTNDL